MYGNEFGPSNMDADGPPAVPMPAKEVFKRIWVTLMHGNNFGPSNMDENRPPAIPMPAKVILVVLKYSHEFV